jgi:hypothetical protein
MNRRLTYFVGPETVLALLSTAVFVPIGFVIGIVVTFIRSSPGQRGYTGLRNNFYEQKLLHFPS